MKPILFSTEMVRAIRDGRKTQTRRVIKPQRVDKSDGTSRTLDEFVGEFNTENLAQFAPIQAGDILWVRETWMPETEQGIPTGGYIYKAGSPAYPDGDNFLRWKPSIHMPKEAARIFLRVTDVHCERLCNGIIGFASPTLVLQAEGIDIGKRCAECIILNCAVPPCIRVNSKCEHISEVVQRFEELWDSINGKRDGGIYAWEKNPWVWVYCFEQIEKSEAVND